MNPIQRTKNWIESFVINYNLCPFAKKPFVQDKIKYVLYEGRDLEELTALLEKELLFLKNTSKTAVETTFLITPDLFEDFYFYLDYLELANDLIFALNLEGTLQIASFHPDYQFGGTEKTDVTNYTNRSPLPLLHLLREDSLAEALAHYEEPESIPERNIETMQKLGLERILGMMNDECN